MVRTKFEMIVFFSCSESCLGGCGVSDGSGTNDGTEEGVEKRAIVGDANVGVAWILIVGVDTKSDSAEQPTANIEMANNIPIENLLKWLILFISTSVRAAIDS
ncbi:hypothetical protein EG832_21985 [bacterium]|nr:hypothetical protein [bacterium]